MSISDALGDMMDQMYMDDEFDEERVKASRVPPPEAGIALTKRSQNSGGVALAVPTVRRAMNDRLSRKGAEEQTRKLQEMLYKAQLTTFASQTVAVVAVRAFQAIDQAQEGITTSYYGKDRTKELQEAMNGVAGQLWQMAAAGIMAITETYPKRVSEEL